MNINENPDKMVYNGNMLTSYKDSDAMAFGVHKGKMMVGYPKQLHMNMCNPKGFTDDGRYYANRFKFPVLNRSMMDFSGRLWLNKKVISFWNPQPKPSELRRMIKTIENEYSFRVGDEDRFKQELINVNAPSRLKISKGWIIETYGGKDATDMESRRPADKSITVGEYLKGISSSDMSSSDNDIEHAVAPLLKKKTIKGMTDKQKKQLWDYFKNKGGLTKADKRMYDMLKNESEGNRIFSMLLNENPDGVIYNGRSLTYNMGEAFPFIMSKNMDTVVQGKNGGTHGDLFWDNSTPAFEGRVWTKSKVISFWNPQPKFSELSKIVSKLNKEFKINIDDTWVLDTGTEDNFYGRPEPLSDFIRLKKTNKGFTDRVDHVVAPLLKKKNLKNMTDKQKKQLWDYFKDKGKKNMDKAELRMYSMIKREARENGFLESMLTENPDHIFNGGKVIASWNDKGAVPFGEIKRIEHVFDDSLYHGALMTIAKNNSVYYTHSHLLGENAGMDHWNDIIEYVLLDEREDYNESHEYESGDDGYQDPDDWGVDVSRSDFDIKGRLWDDIKVISFWNPQPKPSELKSILNRISKANSDIGNSKIKFDNNWRIEVYEATTKETKTMLVPILDFIKGNKTSVGTPDVNHVVAPLLKKKSTKNMSDKQKKQLWDYFMDKGKKKLDKAELRLYKMIHKESESNRFLAKLLLT